MDLSLRRTAHDFGELAALDGAVCGEVDSTAEDKFAKIYAALWYGFDSKLKQGVEVEDSLDADLPQIQAFGSELNQVWTNLIDNAIAAMDRSGSLKIRSAPEDGGV